MIRKAERDEAMIDMYYKDKKSMQEIADHFSVHRKTVWQVLHSSSVGALGVHKEEHHDPVLKDMLQDRYDGFSTKEISAKYNVPHLIVKYYIDKDHFPKYFLKES
jgi:hypothetical protein